MMSFTKILSIILALYVVIISPCLGARHIVKIHVLDENCKFKYPPLINWNNLSRDGDPDVTDRSIISTHYSRSHPSWGFFYRAHMTFRCNNVEKQVTVTSSGKNANLFENYEKNILVVHVESLVVESPTKSPVDYTVTNGQCSYKLNSGDDCITEVNIKKIE